MWHLFTGGHYLIESVVSGNILSCNLALAVCSGFRIASGGGNGNGTFRCSKSLGVS